MIHDQDLGLNMPAIRVMAGREECDKNRFSVGWRYAGATGLKKMMHQWISKVCSSLAFKLPSELSMGFSGRKKYRMDVSTASQEILSPRDSGI